MNLNTYVYFYNYGIIPWLKRVTLRELANPTGEEVLDYESIWDRYGRTVDDIEDPFVWRTHKGVYLEPFEMSAPHLFYTIRMLWNNVMPSCYRIGDFKPYPDIKKWSAEYLQRAMFELSKELNTRLDELEEEQFEEYVDITLFATDLAMLRQSMIAPT